jgi:hypothetical protein
MPLRKALIFAWLAFAAPWIASAGPSAGGVISGTVTTLDGKVRLPGVVITLTSPSGAPAGETVTDEQGAYRLEVSAGGRYQIRTNIEGFHQANQLVDIVVGSTRIVDLDLRLIEIQQSVDVTPTNDSPLDLSKPLSPAESIDGRRLSSSALVSGSVAAELRWLPGVEPYGREWAIKGGRPNQIGLQVEGAQVVDPASGTSPVQLPGDAVNSIQVLANPYAVEFGRFSSGVIVVSTRSGINKWTATVNNFLPGFILERGGNPLKPIGIESFNPRIAIGGPILKDRLFLAQSTQLNYDSREVASRPQDQRSVSKSVSSFTRLDYVVNSRNSLTGMFTLAPESTNSVNLGTFDPPEVTADLNQRVYRAGVIDTAQLPHAMVLETLAHFTRYHSEVDGHGTATDMNIAPEGNSGIYYAKETRVSDAWQVSSTLSKFVSGLWGEHLLKAGLDVLRAGFSGQRDFRPVNLLREDGTLTRRFTSAPSQIAFSSTDGAMFVQDRWHLTNRLLLELGLRFERDGVFDQFNLTPRLGAAFALDEARNATIRGGWGFFYERTPTLAGVFQNISPFAETAYAADGKTPLGPPVVYAHTFEGQRETPRSSTWNIGYEHKLRPSLSIRVNHLERDGRRELILDSRTISATQGVLELESTGRSRYRDTEAGFHYTHGPALDADVSYTHSSSLADLNDAFGYFLNLTANPVVRGNQFGPTDTDAPDRLVGRVRALAGRNWTFEVAAEIRSGFPYSAVNQELEFVGARNSLRFPLSKSLDASIERRFRIGRFEPWIGFVFVNALNLFNPSDVQRNVASPLFGSFYSAPVRQIRLTVHFHP